MFSFFESNCSRQAIPCTEELFNRSTRDARLLSLCAQVAGGDLELKKRLPVVTWQSWFEPGTPRRSSSARATGLVMLDIDHVDQAPYNSSDPRELYDRLLRDHGAVMRAWCVVAHKTPSTHGLRLVFRLSGEMLRQLCTGELTIADVQADFAARLGLKVYDTATCDWARCSYLVPFDYFYCLDKDIFNLNNQIYEIKQLQGANVPQRSTAHCGGGTDSGAPDSGTSSPAAPDSAALPAHQPSDGQYPSTYHGIGYERIVSELTHELHPAEIEIGERNMFTFHLLMQMRFLCNFEAEWLFQIAPRLGLPERELWATCQSVARRERSGLIPNELNRVLRRLERELLNVGGGSSAAGAPDGADDNAPVPLPPLPPIFSELVSLAPSDFKSATLLSLLPILGTLMSRLRATYSDGEVHSPTFYVIVEAPQASGKSFTRRLVNTCMSMVDAIDEQERQRERDYRQQMRRLKLSKKKLKPEEVPDPPVTLVRRMPASSSTTKFLIRMENAQGLHLFCFLEELDSLTKTNQAGAWARKDDIMRLGYDNATYGQDYVAEDGYSGVVPIYYNLLACSTPEGVRQFFGTAENGLISRQLFVVLPSQFGARMPDFKQLTPQDARHLQTRLASLHGELCCSSDLNVVPRHTMNMDWLCRSLDQWNEKQRLQSIKEVSYARNTFYRRAAVNGFRAGMMAHYLWGEHRDRYSHEKVIRFAVWVAEQTLKTLLQKYGEEIDLQMEKQSAKQTKRAMIGQNMYDRLPAEFNQEQLQKILDCSGLKTPARMIVYCWKKQGLISINKETGYVKMEN